MHPHDGAGPDSKPPRPRPSARFRHNSVASSSVPPSTSVRRTGRGRRPRVWLTNPPVASQHRRDIPTLPTVRRDHVSRTLRHGFTLPVRRRGMRYAVRHRQSQARADHWRRDGYASDRHTTTREHQCDRRGRKGRGRMTTRTWFSVLTVVTLVVGVGIGLPARSIAQATDQVTLGIAGNVPRGTRSQRGSSRRSWWPPTSTTR